ncbi:MAG: glycosyltransferase family 2 protein [Coprococcus sp.]
MKLFFIDDGSKDNSGIIIDKLEKQDKRIRVVHQDNQGVSSARNAGIQMATGEYITFVDGDDWVDADYISYFVHMLEKSKCDIAMNKNNYTETQSDYRG